VKKPGDGYSAMKSGMKALYVAGNVPDDKLKADFVVVQASHMTSLAEKADVVLPMTALYERAGSIVDTYGKQKTLASALEAAGDAKDGVDIASELSLVISKTKGFKTKDVVAAVKKFKAGKLAAASFKPVSAKPSKSAAASASALLKAMNQGMLSGSAVSKVIAAKETVAAR